MADKASLVRTLRAFDALREEWNALAARFEHPLLSHEWFSCCARAFHDEGELAVVVVRSAEQMVAAAPLVRVRSRGAERLELLGSRPLNEPSGVLYGSEEALADLVERILALRLPVWLGRLEAGSPVRSAFHARRGRRAVVVDRVTHPSLAVEMRGCWEDYVAGLSAHFKKDLRRQRKRLAEFGPVRSETRSPTSAEATKLLEALMGVEASGWKGRRGSAMARNVRVRDFFRRYTVLAAERGELRVSCLHAGERLAAAELSLEVSRRMWQLKIGYDESLAKYSPGSLLTHDTLAYAFSRGLEAFEFLGSAEPWEERWGAVPRRYASILAYPWSMHGLWGLAADIGARAVSAARAKRAERRGREAV
jgi:CelD/BcsL family acetyltransferase involved in cellulose biosynthesis